MDVKSILDRKGRRLLTVAPDATIEEAAIALRDNRIGALVVVGTDGRIAGILSERDIVTALPEFRDRIGRQHVARIMTTRVITCSAEMSQAQVLDVMVSNGIRHLPVIENDRLAGVISLRDVVGRGFDAPGISDTVPASFYDAG